MKDASSKMSRGVILGTWVTGILEVGDLSSTRCWSDSVDWKMMISVVEQLPNPIWKHPMIRASPSLDFGKERWLYAKQPSQTLSENSRYIIGWLSLAEYLQYSCLLQFGSGEVLQIDVYTAWTSTSSLGFPGSSLESMGWDVALCCGLLVLLVSCCLEQHNLPSIV